MAIQRQYDIKNLVRELAENKVSVLEIVREALSNAKDHGASRMWIKTARHRSSGLVNVTLIDDGEGMDEERLDAFWGVGASSKQEGTSIGYKGHGTKLYFKCRRLRVVTRTGTTMPWRVSSLDRPYEYDGDKIELHDLNSSDPLTGVIRNVGLADGKGTVIDIEELEFPDSDELLERMNIESYCDWFTVIARRRAAGACAG